MAQRLEAALRKPKTAESRDANAPSTSGNSAPEPEQAIEAEIATSAPPPPPAASPAPPPLPLRAARPAETKPVRRRPRRRKAKRFTKPSSRRWRVCWAVQQARPDDISLGPPRPCTNGGGLSSGSYCFGDAARRPGHQHQSRPRRRSRRAERAHHPVDRTVDGAVACSVDSGDDDLVHPDRGGAVAACARRLALRPRRPIRSSFRSRCSSPPS